MVSITKSRLFCINEKCVCILGILFINYAWYVHLLPLFNIERFGWEKKYGCCIWFSNQHVVCLYCSYFVVYDYSSWHHLFKVCSLVKCFIPRCENVAITLFVDEYFFLFGLQTRLSDRSCCSVLDWMNVIC